MIYIDVDCQHFILATGVFFLNTWMPEHFENMHHTSNDAKWHVQMHPSVWLTVQKKVIHNFYSDEWQQIFSS